VTVTILTGDSRAVLPTLEAGSVQCCVCSPPYFALRSYLDTTDPQKALEIGAEPTPELYIAALVEVFREVRRVLRPDGTLWVVIGDSYASTPSGALRSSGLEGGQNGQVAFRQATANKRIPDGLKPKDLIGIPYMLAFALRADGWWWRSAITWCKGNNMPESVTDRPTQATEMVLLFAKSAKYFYDQDAIRDPLSPLTIQREQHPRGRRQNGGGSVESMSVIPFTQELGTMTANPAGRNKRNWWVVNSQPYGGAHFATYPEKLIEPMVLAGSSAHGACSVCGAPWQRVVERETTGANDRRPDRDLPPGMMNHKVRAGDSTSTTTGWAATCPHTDAPTQPCVVLDCFGGSGTTAKVATKHGRDAILIELNPAYVDQALDRTNNVQTMMDVTS
jgi:DNA modification methylase